MPEHHSLNLNIVIWITNIWYLCIVLFWIFRAETNQAKENILSDQDPRFKEGSLDQKLVESRPACLYDGWDGAAQTWAQEESSVLGHDGDAVHGVRRH